MSRRNTQVVRREVRLIALCGCIDMVYKYKLIYGKSGERLFIRTKCLPSTILCAGRGSLRQPIRIFGRCLANDLCEASMGSCPPPGLHDWTTRRPAIRHRIYRDDSSLVGNDRMELDDERGFQGTLAAHAIG
jgi:hypothetical protein